MTAASRFPALLRSAFAFVPALEAFGPAVFAAGALLFAPALPAAQAESAPPGGELPPGLYAEIATPRGAFTCEIFFREAPLAAANFAGLAEGRLGPAPRRPFYDGLTFHRVVAGFMVQGGDPSGTGDGDPGYRFPDDFNARLRFDGPGVLAMANEGPDTNGSQFFVTLAETRRLDFLYTIFGGVVRGLDVLPKIRAGDAMRVTIRRVGAAAQAFRDDEDAFAALRREAKTHPAPPASGPSAPFVDADHLLPEGRAEPFALQLANLRRVTGLPLDVRLLARPSADETALAPAAIAQRRARAAGALADGVMAVYLADRDQWALWMAPSLEKKFAGGQPPAAALKSFVVGARRVAAATAAGVARTLGPGVAIPAGMKIKYFTDAVIDGLILRLAPPSADTSDRPSL